MIGTPDFGNGGGLGDTSVHGTRSQTPRRHSRKGSNTKRIGKDETAVSALILRSPRTLEAILSQEVTSIQDEILPVVERVKEASRGLLETTQYGDLEEASQIIGKMSKELRKLKPPSILERVPYFGTRLAASIERKILVRKSIKEVLDEAVEHYRTVAGNLKGNIGNVTRIEEASMEYARFLEAAIARLEEEKALLDEAITHWDKDDVRGLNNAQSKLRAYQASINNATTFLATQRNTVIQCGVQRQTREMLYSTMTTLAPHVETLANQQLTMLVSGNEVSSAVRINSAAIESVRAATVTSARMTRENAEAVAAAAYSPIIDEATIQASKKELLSMIKNVNGIIEKALAEGTRAAEAARKSEREIEDALRRNVLTGSPSSSRKQLLNS